MKKSQKNMITFYVFIGILTLTGIGVIKETTVYQIVKDVLHYAPFAIAILAVLLFIIYYLVVKIAKATKKERIMTITGGLFAMHIMGKILLFMCLIFDLFIVCDILNCEYSFLPRTGFEAEELSRMAEHYLFYRLGFSAIVALGVSVFISQLNAKLIDNNISTDDDD